MTATTKGTAVLAFGLADETWGLIESHNNAHSADKLEITNGQGEVVTVIYYNHKNEVDISFSPLDGTTGTALCLTADNLVGKVITITPLASHPVTILIDSATRKYSKGAELKFDIKGTIYPAITVTADVGA